MEEIVRVDLNGNVIERSESCLYCVKRLECEKRKAAIDDESFFETYLDCPTEEGIEKYRMAESKLLPCKDFKDYMDDPDFAHRLLRKSVPLKRKRCS